MESERRKVQLTGKSTYIISIPKKWAVEMGIKEGDELVIEKQDGLLRISPKAVKRANKTGEVTLKLSATEDPHAGARKVVSLYLVGYNVIRLQAEEERISAPQRETIKQFVRTKLVGMEITTDLPNEMVLQVLMSYPELSVKDALKRMCLIATSMKRDAISALENFDETLARDVIGRDDEVDRFGMYVIRQLKSAVQEQSLIKEIGLETPRDCLGYRLIAKIIERVSDHVVLIAQNILQMKGRVGRFLVKKIKEMDSFVSEIFEDAVKSLFEGDYEMAEKVIERGRALVEVEEGVVREVLRRASREHLIALRLIIESLRRIGEYGSDIAEIVLNLNATKMVEGR